ncbi:MAG: hypothetical protein ACJ73S_23825 [Mycobacteriales bacterium]
MIEAPAVVVLPPLVVVLAGADVLLFPPPLPEEFEDEQAPAPARSATVASTVRSTRGLMLGNTTTAGVRFS